MIPRLYIPGPLTPGAVCALEREPSHHLCRVLRMAAGDTVEVFDGLGSRHPATIADPDPRRCTVTIGEPFACASASPLGITLAQCVSAGEKMDWTIEKAVELGVAAIAPLLSQRSVVRLDAERSRKRAEHWQRIVVAACMQCGQDRLPDLAPVQPLPAWLATPEEAPQGQAPAAGTLRVVLVPGAPTRLADVAPPSAGSRSVQLLVGPESGLSGDEVVLATRAGFQPVSLGPRVLRTETAGLAAIAILQSRFGDL